MLVEKHLEEAIIHSYHTHQDGKVKVSALFNLMMEAAWAHAAKLSWGYDNLKANEMFWALSRIRIEVKQLPKWRDRIYLETWPAGNDRMFAYREFRFKDSNGNELLRANSAWLVLNLNTHKIVSFTEQTNLPYQEDEKPCQQPKRLRYKSTGNISLFQPVRYSDIDVNKHLNSVRAFERIIDEQEASFQKKYYPETIEINYLKEGFEGQHIGVEQQTTDGVTFSSALFRQEDNELLSLYEIKWAEIA